ncbi:hypothetical protein ACFE04_031071 [Oxalis oulophora]
MVMKRRIDHGFQIADIPRGPRSIRRRSQCKKPIVDDDNICAFELLASLAGKLLQESESSISSNHSEEHDQSVVVIKDGIDLEKQDDITVKAESGGAYEVSAVSEAASQNDDAVVERTSTISIVNCQEKFSADIKSGKFHIDNVLGDFPDSDGNSEIGFGQIHQEPSGVIQQCSRKDPLPLELSLKFPALINTNSNVKSPTMRDPVRNASFARRKNDIKLGSRDDDEKLFRYNKLNNKFKAYRFTRIGDRRIRKLLSSKYWKTAPTLKDYEFSKADVGRKPFYRKRKTCYGHERDQRESLYKRKKFSDGAFSSESVSNSPLKGSTGGKCFSAAELHKAKVTGHEASLHPKDSHVKFSIKSFRVPELFVEVPETATVGSLKRTVMEAVTAMLGGGIRIGVVLQGKKVRDDNRTLSQTGISCEDNLNALGFTLEPSVVPLPPTLPVGSEDPPLKLPCETPQQERSSVPPVLDSGIPDILSDPSSLTDSSNHVDSTQESVSKQTDSLTDQNQPDSRALVPVPDPVPVPVPAIKVEPLAVVHVNQKASRRSELAQRRTRRPFSVTEVEALVRAVEELGTGRWRDVKLRSFENADHRTYVDLKDKWKTLVHTAKIAPQQRRGEPVPQDLLDRVLAAHAYWCTHQAKQQGKNQTVVPLMIADADTDTDSLADNNNDNSVVDPFN